MKIHHNTLKRAAKYGVLLNQTDAGGFIAIKAGYASQRGLTAADALDLMLLEIQDKKVGGFTPQTSRVKLNAPIKENMPRDVKPSSIPTKLTEASVKKVLNKMAATNKNMKVGAKKEDKKPEDATPNHSVVKKEYKTRYAKNGGNSGSPISKALSDALLGEGAAVLPKILAENGVKWIYGGLDVGRARMCCGTILKGMDRRGEVVKILGKRVTNGRDYYEE